jgi:hypothetical protein
MKMKISNDQWGGWHSPSYVYEYSSEAKEPRALTHDLTQKQAQPDPLGPSSEVPFEASRP